jgi:phosphogluconate dehydratase
LLHEDVQTILGHGLSNFCQEPFIGNGALEWRPVTSQSLDEDIVRPADKPFAPEGGLRLVHGNLGRGITKVSAVDEDHQSIKAPAKIFHSQAEFADAFKAGELECDFVAVLAFQGPKATGMPELHKLTPYLGVLQNRGFKVALLTDGRMSGASGKVLSAIQVVPEAIEGGSIGHVRDGDIISIDAQAGVLHVDSSEALDSRELVIPDLTSSHYGMGREMFTAFRTQTTNAEAGATIFGDIT